MDMTKLKAAFVASACAATFAAFAPGARAQFSTLALPTQTEGSGSATPTPTTGGATVAAGTRKNSAYSVNLFPYAPFQVGFKADVAGISVDSKGTTNGILIAPEAIFAAKNGRTGYGFGGWYWARTETGGDDSDKAVQDLFDIHGRYLFTPQIGVQLGYLGNARVKGGFSDFKQQGVNLFATYNYASPPKPDGKGGTFGANVGLGVQQIASTDLFESSAFFTGFAAVSYEPVKNFSVNLSYYFLTGDQNLKLLALPGVTPALLQQAGIGDKLKSNFNQSRFAVGVGYRF